MFQFGRKGCIFNRWWWHNCLYTYKKINCIFPYRSKFQMNIKLQCVEINSCFVGNLGEYTYTLGLHFHTFGPSPIINVFYTVTQKYAFLKSETNFTEYCLPLLCVMPLLYILFHVMKNKSVTITFISWCTVWETLMEERGDRNHLSQTQAVKCKYVTRTMKFHFITTKFSKKERKKQAIPGRR